MLRVRYLAYIVRKMETGVEVPEGVLEKRQVARESIIEV